MTSNTSAYEKRIQDLFDLSQSAASPAIRLGIDIGTSCSKVMWRGETTVSTVRFGSDEHALSSYFMRSLVAFDGENLLCGDAIPVGLPGHRISNFKMCLACSANPNSECRPTNCSLTTWPTSFLPRELAGEEVPFVNACFAAKVMSSAKRIITLELVRSLRSEVRPKWSANIAVPEKFIEQSPVAERFRKTFRTAWLMSLVLDEMDISDLQVLGEIYLAASSVAVLSLDVLNDEEFGCAIYPEIGAEVASIVLSKVSEKGLYAFVDIGAGTIDASLFNYFVRNGKANRPPFAADVSRHLGAAQVELRASRMAGHSFTVDQLKQTKEIYNQLDDSEKRLLTDQFILLKRALAEMKPQIRSFLQTVFGSARDEKDANVVNQKIRLVLGGGGALLKGFRESAIAAFTRKDSKDPIAPEQVDIKIPSSLSFPLLPTEFHRFSVAYGLTFPFSELPEMVFPKDVLPKTPPRKILKDHGAFYQK